MVSFAVSDSEVLLIHRIVVRAVHAAGKIGLDGLELEMDLTAAHANGCPLDLEKLAAFDDFNLLHDVLGIRRHIDRTTGQLGDCFLPRCAMPEGAHV